MEQLRRQNAEKINLNRMSVAVKTLSEKRKREDNIIKDIRNIFTLRKYNR